MKRKREKYKNVERFLIRISRLIKILPKGIRLKLFEHYRYTKGNKGLAIRYILLRTLVRKCGKNISIHPNVYIFHPENLELGNNISIHPMTYIECGQNGLVCIGNDVSIAHGVTILAENHRYDRVNIPIKDQGVEYKDTIIEDNVWIGAKATILYGRTIKSGSIIGANSVVTKNVENNSIVAGIPAKLIKERK